MYNYSLENYLDNKIILKRFTTFEDLKKQLNEDLIEWNCEIKDYCFKTDYDNDFEDYLITFTIYKDKEPYIDLDIYYAVSRIGERIIVESNFWGAN